MLNRRMLNIIEYLIKSEEYRSIKQLAKLSGVGERTVRYDIDAIDIFLENIGLEKIRKNPRKGLLLEDPQEVRRYLRENFHHRFAIEFRLEEMLIDIAFGGKINIAHTCKRLQLSRTTVRSDLLNIKGILNEYGLNLNVSTGKGLVLSGKEFDKRRFQVKILNDFFSTDKNGLLQTTYTTVLIKKYMEGICLEGVDEFIGEITAREQRPVSSNALLSLTNYVIVMVLRVKGGHCLSEAKKQDASEGKALEAINTALSVLEARYQIILDDVEVDNLRGYFLGSHLSNDEPALFFSRGWFELETIIEELIRSIGEACGINLMKDDFLVDGLINHIKPTIHRVKNSVALKDSVYEEVAKECYELFCIVEDALVHLERFVGLPFPNEEVALLTVHFQGSIKRNQYTASKVTRIMLVCGEGAGVSRLIRDQLTEDYRFQVATSVAPSQLDKAIQRMGSDVDLIVTTSLVDIETTIPVVDIRTIIKDYEVRKLNIQGGTQGGKRVLLSSTLEAVSRGAIIQDRSVIIRELQGLFGRSIINDIEVRVPTLTTLMPEENILLGCVSKTWEEAVSMAGEILVRGGYVYPEYIDEMVGNIHKYGSYVVVFPMLAIPHADKEYVHRSGISLVALAEPVIFPEGIKVDTVLAFSSANNREHLQALSSFLDMVESHSFMDIIRGASSSNKVIASVKKYDFLVNIK